MYSDLILLGYSGKCNNPFKKLDHNICKDTFLKIIFDFNTNRNTQLIHGKYCKGGPHPHMTNRHNF